MSKPQRFIDYWTAVAIVVANMVGTGVFTTLGLVRLRIREPGLPRPFRVPLYPLTPILFVALSGVGLVFVAWQRPVAVIAVGLLLLLGGWLLGRAGES